MAAGTHPDAGKLLPAARLVDVERLVRDYRERQPALVSARERVTFGTSGHRGSASSDSFNEAHILAIAQAICLDRRHRGIDGPLFMGRDTHALSEPAFQTAIEVFVANDVTVVTDARNGFTPTPAVSHAILAHNRAGTSKLADGVVVTPSHNPPEDGGIKYNPPHGGPAEADVAGAIETIANILLEDGLRGVRRTPLPRPDASEHLQLKDYRRDYVDDLTSVIDLQAVAAADIRIGLDPLGGASIHYWPEIIERYGLNGRLVDDRLDPRFSFVPADWDGRIRMDCSSPYAMSNLVASRSEFDVAAGNDPDADRHGIVTREGGLMHPNDFLVAAASYLFAHRSSWPIGSGIGKTMVTTRLLDRLAARLGRPLVETPVGFKWFVDGLLAGSLAFAGEESAGASLARMDGTVWTTEKDGIVMGLLAAEMMARTGRDPAVLYRKTSEDLGASCYRRTDAPATPVQKERLRRMAPGRLQIARLAGEPVVAIEASAPGSDAPFGGIRVQARSGWFAARPSGTEDVYKLYAESFRGPEHLAQIEAEAKAMISVVLGGNEGG